MNLVVDIGVTSEDKARSVGVKEGTPITYQPNFATTGVLIKSKSLDNRVGCTLLAHLAKSCSNPPNTLYLVGTVREEFGYTGVFAACESIRPDIAIVVDVTFVNDVTPQQHESLIALGSGPAITMRDGGMIGYPNLVQAFTELTQSSSIPYQIEVVEHGVSEAAKTQSIAGGIPSIGVFVLARGNHIATEIINVRDLEFTVSLITAAVMSPALLMTK